MAMEAVWARMARFDEDFRESVDIDVKTHDVLLDTHSAGEGGVRMTVLARPQKWTGPASARPARTTG